MLRVCRICLAEIQSESGFYIVNTVEEQTGFMPIRDKLTMVVPEMALDLVMDPILCVACKSSLQIAYNFKQLCLNTDKRLHKSMKYSTLHNGCLNLESVLKILKGKGKLKALKSTDDSGGEEQAMLGSPENMQERDEDTESKYSNENSKSEEPIESIKSELNDQQTESPEKSDEDDESRISDEMVQENFIELYGVNHEHIGKMLMCKVCSIKLMPHMNLKKHLLNHENSCQNCNLCDKKFINQYNYWKHMKTHHTRKSYRCRVCLEVFHDKVLFKKHGLEHVKEEEENQDNTIDNIPMEATMEELDNSSISLGESSVDPSNPVAGSSHACCVCNRKFKAQHYLKRHEKTHFAQTGKMFKCQQCQKTFKDKLSFKRHSHDGATGQVVKQSKNRNTLPKEAKQIMKKWLYAHQDNPYPTDAEKQDLVKRTKLKYIQVENWFVNARRRILHKTREYFERNDDDSM